MNTAVFFAKVNLIMVVAGMVTMAILNITGGPLMITTLVLAGVGLIYSIVLLVIIHKNITKQIQP